MVARFIARMLCITVLVSGGLMFPAPEDQAAAQTGASTAPRYVTIDFNNVDINIFIKYISELTGVNFVVDPSVQGQVTIISPTKISEKDAYSVFESVLEINGYTTVPGDTVTKIVPLATARSQSVDIVRGEDESEPGDRIVTQLVPLKHTSPLEINQVLKPLISKTSVIVAHTQSGMLIITDTKSNIKRLLAIIETLDVPYSRGQVAVIPLEHGNVRLFQRGSDDLSWLYGADVLRSEPSDRSIDVRGLAVESAVFQPDAERIRGNDGSASHLMPEEREC